MGESERKVIDTWCELVNKLLYVNDQLLNHSYCSPVGCQDSLSILLSLYK